MTTRTIKTTFDPRTLPKWAQQNPDVIALAARDLGYRCAVCVTKSPAYRRALIDEAARRKFERR